MQTLEDFRTAFENSGHFNAFPEEEHPALVERWFRAPRGTTLDEVCAWRRVTPYTFERDDTNTYVLVGCYASYIGVDAIDKSSGERCYVDIPAFVFAELLKEL